MNMSTEEFFVRHFARLFARYCDALTLDAGGECESELQRLNEAPVVKLDRMVSAARLALLEIEKNARAQDDARHYYAKPGGLEWGAKEYEVFDAW
jgi:hypothetical protein